MKWFWKYAESEEEKLAKKNAELDRKIAQKELEIKYVKRKLKIRKEIKARRRMRKHKASITEVNISGAKRTSEKYE